MMENLDNQIFFAERALFQIEKQHEEALNELNRHKIKREDYERV